MGGQVERTHTEQFHSPESSMTSLPVPPPRDFAAAVGDPSSSSQSQSSMHSKPNVNEHRGAQTRTQNTGGLSFTSAHSTDSVDRVSSGGTSPVAVAAVSASRQHNTYGILSSFDVPPGNTATRAAG